MSAAAVPASASPRPAPSLVSGKSLLTQTSLYGFFVVARRAVQLVLTPVYTHYLSPHDFGTLEILSLGAWLSTIIGVCKVDAAFYRYYVAARTGEERGRILSGGVLLTLSISTLLLGIAGLGFPLLRKWSGQGNSIPLDAFFLMLLATWLDLTTLVPFAYCRATERVRFIGLVSVSQAIISGTCAAVGVIVLGLGFRAVLWGTLLGTLSTALACVWVIRRERLRLTFHAAPVLLRYGMPMLPGTLFMYVMSSTDRYFLARAHGLADVGLYAVAAKFALILQMVIMTPFGEMWAANQFKLHAAGLKSLYERTALAYLAILFGAALGIGYFAYDFVSLAFAADYHLVAEIVPLLTFGVALWGIVPTMDLGSLVAPNKTWIRSLAVGIAAIVNVVANVMLVPTLGVYGAALASIAGYAVLAIATAALNYPLVDMRAPIGRVLLMVGGLVVALLAAHASRGLPTLRFLGLRVACFAGYAGFLYVVAWRSTAPRTAAALSGSELACDAPR
jgi:O-antigen/teichoic acid export membrane protein